MLLYPPMLLLLVHTCTSVCYMLSYTVLGRCLGTIFGLLERYSFAVGTSDDTGSALRAVDRPAPGRAVNSSKEDKSTAVRPPRASCAVFWHRAHDLDCLMSRGTARRDQGKPKKVRRKGSPLAPLKPCPSIRSHLLCCSLGGVDPKLRIHSAPRHFPDCRDREGAVDKGWCSVQCDHVHPRIPPEIQRSKRKQTNARKALPISTERGKSRDKS